MAFGDNWELNHVGLMISDRNATLRHFQSIGVGVSVGPNHYCHTSPATDH